MESLSIKRFYGFTAEELSDIIKRDILDGIDDCCRSFEEGFQKKNFDKVEVNSFIAHMRQEYTKSFEMHQDKMRALVKEFLTIQPNVVLPCDKVGQKYHAEDEEQLKSTLLELRQKFKEIYAHGKIAEKLINNFKGKEMATTETKELKNSSQEVKYEMDEMLNSLKINK